MPPSPSLLPRHTGTRFAEAFSPSPQMAIGAYDRLRRYDHKALRDIAGSKSFEVRSLLISRRDARGQWHVTKACAILFSRLELLLVLATLAFGIASTIYAARGEPSLWPGISSTALGSLLALLRGESRSF